MNEVLFYDPQTPLAELIKTLTDNPVCLSGADAQRLCGEGKLFEMWPSDTGYTVGVINLHACIRDNNLSNTDVVLRIPQSVDGIPVTRIASGAFMKWLSYDTRIRFLDFPEGMHSIARGCLNPLSVENIYLPSTLTHIEPQIFSVGTHAQIQRTVHFFAHKNNPVFTDYQGSLYNKDHTTLVFAAFPYEETMTLHEETKHIAEHAFVKCETMPRFIHCPSNLEDTKDFVSDDTIWLRDEGSRFASFIDKKNFYGACHTFFEEDGAYYDIINDDEVRLIRSNCNHEEFNIPTQIHDCTLKHIGPYALPHYVSRLDIPSTITTIAHDNTCPCLKRLILHDGIVSIGERCFTSRIIDNTIFLPQSLKTVGNASFPRCTCRICAENCNVNIPDFAHARLFGRQDMLFDFERYDTQLTSIKAPKTRTQAILERLGSSHPVAEETIPELIGSLATCKNATIHAIAEIGTVALLDVLINHGFYTEETANQQIELLQQSHKPDGVARLIQFKHSLAPAQQKARPSSRFAL